MSGLENMSALSEANAEADTRQKMKSPQLWRRLELYRLAHSSSREDEKKRREMVLCLLKEVELRLLFVAADLSYQPEGGEAKRRAVNTALISVFESSVGPELFQNNAEVVPYFLAGLCHPAAGAKTLTAKTLVALGLHKSEGRGNRCCALLQPPLLPALVAVLGDSDTGAAQAAADAMVVLCDTVSLEAGRSLTTVSEADCHRTVMEALASQLDEVIAGMTDRQAATPKLRFADTAARLMGTSELAFVAALDAGALPLVTNLTHDSSDALLQLNALELLEKVASTAAGARHLVTSGHLSGLITAAGGGEGGIAAPPDPLLGASSLRTLANVLAKAAGVGLDVWAEFGASPRGGFLQACTVHIEGRDEAGKLAGLVAASTVAEASNEALKAMLAQEYGTEGVLDAWLTISSQKVEVKAAALHALAMVLGPPTNASPLGADEVMGNTVAAEERETRSLLCRALFERLGVCNRRSAGTLIVELAHQPVPEVRHAAYDVLRCTVWQPGGWGLSAVFSQPGFRSYLESRETGVSKATKEWKFSVVEAVMRCRDRGVLGQDALDSFRNILQQGPFWVPAKSPDVATLQ